jgi:hypothetical protein
MAFLINKRLYSKGYIGEKPMIDIILLMKVYDLKYKIMGGQKFERDLPAAKTGRIPQPEPVVYNIETTTPAICAANMCRARP